MMIAGQSFASSALASLTPVSTATSDVDSLKPFRLYVGGVEAGDDYLAGTGSMSSTLGEQATMQFKLYGQPVTLTIGLPIRWMYFSQVLFDGMLTSWEIEIEPSQSMVIYSCEATDWSALLTRHKIRRNFVNASLVSIVDSLLDNELAGNGLSIGTIESWLALPLVDSNGGSALDVLKDAGAALGLVLTIDHDKRIHLRADTLPIAPFVVNESIIEQVLTLENTTDDYRNVQTVTVKGTTSDDTDPLEISYTKENTDQIEERAALEGNDGRYEAVDTVTHPTSNDELDLQVLAQGYATAKLATAGSLRQSIRCRVRGYGWEPGQLVTMSHNTAEISGSYTIQQVDVEEIDAVLIRSTLTLTPDTLIQRAYQSWLRMIDRGQVVVQLPGTAAASSITVIFSTAGSFNWVVPAGVTVVTLTLTGASGSGSGSNEFWFLDSRATCIKLVDDGRKGGNGGYAIASVNVVAGQTLNLVVGAKGTPGGATGKYGTASCFAGSPPGDGHDATDTTVHRSGVLLCAAYKGGKALAPTTTSTASAGTPGGYSGGIGSVGGGKVGGAGGLYWTPGQQNGKAGKDGIVMIQYVA